MTIYKTLLGADFARLHPKLQSRYALLEGKPFLGEGTMRKIENGGFWLRPFLSLAARFKFLFPESGENVPFTISNTCRQLPNGDHEVYWERTFYFKKRKRQFNAFMTIDAERGIVRDYLGEPSFFYSDLAFQVTGDGRLQIRSGRQRVVFGKVELPIPRALGGTVAVEEGYDESREAFTISVDIRNGLIGRLISYEGEFKERIL